jgi:hypothetical protein
MPSQQHKWLGLSICTISVLTAIGVGVLAFAGRITVDRAISLAPWCLIGFAVGFGLHIYVILENRERRDKPPMP